MTIHAIAHGFYALCSEGKLDEAQRFWSDDVVSVEALPSPFQVTRGRAAVVAKQQAWTAQVTMHGVTCEGPFIGTEEFAILFALDVTMDGRRQTMREVAVYKVAGGAIVEERFLPFMPAAPGIAAAAE